MKTANTIAADNTQNKIGKHLCKQISKVIIRCKNKFGNLIRSNKGNAAREGKLKKNSRHDGRCNSLKYDD